MKKIYIKYRKRILALMLCVCILFNFVSVSLDSRIPFAVHTVNATGVETLAGYSLFKICMVLLATAGVTSVAGTHEYFNQQGIIIDTPDVSIPDLDMASSWDVIENIFASVVMEMAGEQMPDDKPPKKTDYWQKLKKAVEVYKDSKAIYQLALAVPQVVKYLKEGMPPKFSDYSHGIWGSVDVYKRYVLRRDGDTHTLLECFKLNGFGDSSSMQFSAGFPNQLKIYNYGLAMGYDLRTRYNIFSNYTSRFHYVWSFDADSSSSVEVLPLSHSSSNLRGLSNLQTWGTTCDTSLGVNPFSFFEPGKVLNQSSIDVTAIYTNMCYDINSRKFFIPYDLKKLSIVGNLPDEYVYMLDENNVIPRPTSTVYDPVMQENIPDYSTVDWLAYEELVNIKKGLAKISDYDTGLKLYDQKNKKYLEDIADDVSDSLDGIKGILSAIKNLPTNIWNKFKLAINSIKDSVINMPDNLYDKFSEFTGYMTNYVRQIRSDVMTLSMWFGDVIDSIEDGVKDIVSAISDITSSGASWLWVFIYSLINGIVDGFKDTADNLSNGLKDIVLPDVPKISLEFGLLVASFVAIFGIDFIAIRSLMVDGEPFPDVEANIPTYGKLTLIKGEYINQVADGLRLILKGVIYLWLFIWYLNQILSLFNKSPITLASAIRDIKGGSQK